MVVTLLEADTVVGGRARRGLLRSGPVEMGATWFHGTQGNPVYDYAMKLTGMPNSSSSEGTGEDETVKDYTANANGSDPRWGSCTSCCRAPVRLPAPISAVSGPCTTAAAVSDRLHAVVSALPSLQCLQCRECSQHRLLLNPDRLPELPRLPRPSMMWALGVGFRVYLIQSLAMAGSRT